MEGNIFLCLSFLVFVFFFSVEWISISPSKSDSDKLFAKMFSKLWLLRISAGHFNFLLDMYIVSTFGEG